jgi:hypothetical protein
VDEIVGTKLRTPVNQLIRARHIRDIAGELIVIDIEIQQISEAAKVGYRTRELIAADPEVPRLVRPLSEGKALLYGLADAALQRLGDAGEVLADVGSEEGQNLKKFRE